MRSLDVMSTGRPLAASLAVLPVDELALWLLRRIVTEARPTHRRLYFIDQTLRGLGERTPADAAYATAATSPDDTHLAQALAEAWDWLASNGLVAEAVTGMFGGRMPVEGWSFVTRLGRRVASHPRAEEWIAAERRLGVTLHPRLEERARRQFVVGEFAAAAFVAMREVEITVRERAGLDETVIGTDLMNRAFADDGPLTDPGAPRAEQEGLRSLYRGAISVFKNPASHRHVHYDDPTQAAEIVLFADLLLRLIEPPS
jgi:uncharacterized protein (TIGR02391 family)